MAIHFNATGYPLNNAPEVTDKLATCNRRNDNKLSWKKSTRTGKYYLCDIEQCGRYQTRDSPNPRYFQLAKHFHRCA